MDEPSEHLHFARMEPDGMFVVHQVSGMLNAARKGIDGLLTLLSRPPPPPPPSAPKPDTEAFQRFVCEELDRRMGTVMSKFNSFDQRVDQVVESSVRNDSHWKGVKNDFKMFEKSIVEAVNSAKASLSSEMKLLFEAQLKEHKAAHDKSTVQKLDAILRDMETADTFPGRIRKLRDRALYYLAMLDLFVECFLCHWPQATEVSAKLEEVQPKLHELASKLDKLPIKCIASHLQKGKFSDMAETSEDLLHRYFHSGPESGFDLSFSVDAARAAGALIFGDWGPLSITAPDVGPWILQLKTKSNRQLNGVHASLISPELDFNGIIKGGFSLPVPASSVKANVHYLHEYGAVLSSVQLGVDPLVRLSCVFGFKSVSLGADLGFNPVDRLWTKYDAAVRFNSGGVDVAMLTKDMNDRVSGSVCYKFGDYWAFGFENSVTFSTRVNKLFLGVGHAFDPMTTLKARIGLEASLSKADGKLRGVARLVDRRVLGGLALVRRWGRCSAGVSVEVDLHPRSAPRFGLFLKFGAAKEEEDTVQL